MNFKEAFLNRKLYSFTLFMLMSLKDQFLLSWQLLTCFVFLAPALVRFNEFP